MPGLTNQLKRVFWPDYSYDEAKKGANQKVPGTGVRSSREGLNRGKMVHRQLRDYFNLDETKFHIKHPVLHPFTTNAMVSLTEYGLIPLRAELPIYGSGVATAIDAICLDKETSGLVLIEWKTGFDNYLLKGNAAMKGPLGGRYSNCPLHQAFFQLAIEKHIVETHYGARIHASHVIQLTQDGVTPRILPEELDQQSGLLYEHMVSSKQVKR